MDVESLLLSDWNVYMCQTHFWHERKAAGQYMGHRKMTPNNHALLASMVLWCRSRGVEPRLWLFFQFKVRGWRFPPKFDEGCLMSEKMLTKFWGMRTSGLGFFKKRMAVSKAEAEADAAFDPNRDTTPSVESVKQNFLTVGNPSGCMQDVMRTLGFHPKSSVCSGCPIRNQCAVELEAMVPFPILALRAGRITAAEAEKIARARA